MVYDLKPSDESILLAIYYAEQQYLAVVSGYVSPDAISTEARGYIDRLLVSPGCGDFRYRFVLTDEGLKAVEALLQRG